MAKNDSAAVTVLALPARSNVETRYLISRSIPRELLDLAKTDTIDPAGATKFYDVGAFGRNHILIADGARLLVVDSNQKRILNVGREGHGPGEFVTIDGLCQTRGDTIVVSNGGYFQATIDEGGHVSPQFHLSTAQLMQRGGCFGDGTFLAMVHTNSKSFGVARYDVRGSLVKAIGTFDFDWKLGGSSFWVSPVVQAAGELLYVGDPWIPEIREYTSNGEARRILRFADKPVPRKWSLNDTPSIGRPAGNTAPLPPPSTIDHWPYFDSMRVTPTGDIWVKDYPVPRGSPERWTGFSSTGQSLGAITVDSIAAADGSIAIADFNATSVLVRYELPSGQVYYQARPFTALRVAH